MSEMISHLLRHLFFSPKSVLIMLIVIDWKKTKGSHTTHTVLIQPNLL